MADPRFFHRAGPLTLGEIARMTGAEIRGGAPDMKIDDVAPLDTAGPSHVSFLDNVKYRDSFKSSKAGACFAVPEMAEHAPEGMSLLITKSPYKAYAQATQALYPDKIGEGSISPHAHIDPTAKIGPGCVIDAGAVIGSSVEIGEECWIGPNAVIAANVVIGRQCRIGANASLTHCQIGQGTRIYPGARIGQDGFGFAMDPSGFVKVPQLGRVIIGNNVEIGANTCIDRGAGPDTVIGDGTWIDNLVQIGHNVKMGRNCVVVGQAGIAGSTVLEDFVVLAAQSGVAGHLTLGKGARIAAKSGIMKDVAPGEEVMGYPALPIRQFMRQIATLNRLIQKKSGTGQ